jgi:hypothetical protein
VWRFALRTLAWLVPCFAAWYALAPWHARPIAWLGARGVDLFTRVSVSSTEFHGALVTFVTTMQVQVAPTQAGVLAPEVNVLVYTYGAAVLAALMLASRAPLARLVAGLLLLAPFQAWGVAFEVIAELALRTAPEVAAQAGIEGWRREAAALAYQLGSLIFPALVPVMAWAVLQRTYVEALVRPRGLHP